MEMKFCSNLYLLYLLLLVNRLPAFHAFVCHDVSSLRTPTSNTNAKWTRDRPRLFHHHEQEDPSHEPNNHALYTDLDSPLEGSPKITTINCADDLFDFLKEDDRLCIIKYYASWCKSCAKFGMKFKHLAMMHGDVFDSDGVLVKKGQMRFAQVEYGDNRILCKAMGISRLPFVQLYKASTGKIDEFVCGPRDFQEKVKNKVEVLLDLTDDELIFKVEMDQGQSLSNSLLPLLADKERAREGSV